jgi:osmotically inducible protein OsmC
MPNRRATAEWRGDLKSGHGKIKFGDGRFDESYSANSRFGDGKETNPEELIAAAHAGCFSMALSNILAEAGNPPERVHTEARVRLEKKDDGFAITVIHLQTEAKVSGIDNDAFQKHAETAKVNCPVSKALAGCEIRLEAQLL